MTREGITIGSIMIHWYGVLIMLGALLAALLAEKEAKRSGLNPDAVWDMLIWLLLGGVVGARLWHVFTPSASNIAAGITTEYYLTNPLEILKTWKGGLGIPGAVIGGMLALWIYSRVKKTSFLAWTDMIAPGLALAQSIGRIGNFLNQELYGLPSSLPWAIYIDPLHRIPGFESVERYHPLFLYEIIWNLMNMGVLLWLLHRKAVKLKTGDVFLVYLIIYPIGRFMLEFLRLDTSPWAKLNANQTLMAVVAGIAVLLLILKRVIKKKPWKGNEETVETEAAAE